MFFRRVCSTSRPSCGTRSTSAVALTPTTCWPPPTPSTKPTRWSTGMRPLESSRNRCTGNGQNFYLSGGSTIRFLSKILMYPDNYFHLKIFFWSNCAILGDFTSYHITFTITNSDPDTNVIPVHDSWDGNLNLTPYIVKSSAYYNVAIWFAVQIGIGIWIRQCKLAISFYK